MNIRQEGSGICRIHGAPIMQAINQPGVVAVCFACQEDAKEKTGHSIVVTEETGDLKPLKAGQMPAGKVTVRMVPHTVGSSASSLPADPEALRSAIAAKAAKGGRKVADQTLEEFEAASALAERDPFTVTLEVTVDELYEADILITVLKKIYDGLDNLPSGTIKQAKKVIKVQEAIEAKLSALAKETVHE